jgi:hypothetical protein
MRKRVIYTALLALGVLGVAVLYFRAPLDPVYEGRHLSVWLNKLHRSFSGSYNQADREQAEIAIRVMGTNSIPYLLALVRTRDSSFRTNFIELTKKQKVIKCNFRPSASQEQFRGILGLKVLGRTAVEAVPDLLPLLQESDLSVRGIAAEALAKIGPEVPGVIPALLNTLEDPNSYLRQSALSGLGQINPISPHVVSAVEKHLQDPSPPIRSQALEWLLSRSTNKLTYLPALKFQWGDSNPDLRGSALRSVIWLTNSPKEVLPLIKVSLHDTNKSIRTLATNLLATMSAADGAAVGPKRDIFFNFGNTPVADVLELYSSVAGQEVVVPIRLFGSVHVRTYGSVSATEAMNLIETALEEQLHILITKMDDGRLIATVVPQRK